MIRRHKLRHNPTLTANDVQKLYFQDYLEGITKKGLSRSAATQYAAQKNGVTIGSSSSAAPTSRPSPAASAPAPAPARPTSATAAAPSRAAATPHAADLQKALQSGLRLQYRDTMRDERVTSSDDRYAAKVTIYDLEAQGRKLPYALLETEYSAHGGMGSGIYLSLLLVDALPQRRGFGEARAGVRLGKRADDASRLGFLQEVAEGKHLSMRGIDNAGEMISLASGGRYFGDGDWGDEEEDGW